MTKEPNPNQIPMTNAQIPKEGQIQHCAADRLRGRISFVLGCARLFRKMNHPFAAINAFPAAAIV